MENESSVLLWRHETVQGRVYRVLDRQECEQGSPSKEFWLGDEIEGDGDYVDEPSCKADLLIGGDNECGVNIAYDDESGQYGAKVQVPSVAVGLLIGKGGSTKTKLQKETGASFIVPKSGSKGDLELTETTVTIKGPSEGAVASLVTRIQLIVQPARDRVERTYTHFISLPLFSESRKAKAKEFQKTALSTKSRDIDESIFVPAERLHITVAMLQLRSEDELERAKTFMRSFASQMYDAVGTQTLMVGVKGLEYMNDDPSEVDVLYIKVVPNEKLRRLLAVIVNGLVKEGLLSPEEAQSKQHLLDSNGELSIKLHCTLMNSKYRKGSASRSHKRRQFDASLILNTMSTIDFGVERVPAVHLSSRSNIDRKTGYYASVVQVPLP